MSGEHRRAYWDSIADNWRDMRTRNDALAEAFLPHLTCPPGGLLLDAGCGTGAISVPLAARGYRMRGIDFAPRMIANARAVAQEHGLMADVAQFEVSDVAALPFPATHFDGIICRLVLDFALHPGVALIEFLRVLKPGGRLVLLMLGAHSDVKQEWWQRFLPEHEPDIMHNHILPWEMGALLPALGWRIVAQQPLFGGRSFSGAISPYTAETTAHYDDPVILQTLAPIWWFTAEKPR